MSGLRVLQRAANTPDDEDDVDTSEPAPPWPHQPTVEWQVVGQCNYDCSYCIQSKKHRVGIPSDESLRASLQFLAGLPGPAPWEVKTTGGEPFSFRSFLDLVVPGLMATPHAMSTLTNLSAPTATLQKFARLTFGRLRVVSASLHLEHEQPGPFLDRLEALRDAADSSAERGVRIVVNAVLAPENLPAVLAARDAVVARGFRFFPQLMKVKNAVFAYSPAQMEFVRAIVGDFDTAAQTRSANLAPAYIGKRCWAGARYLVLTKEGDAFSCRTAKRYDEGWLGNTISGISLNGGFRRCSYAMCPCATPANRGMIEGVSPSSAGAGRASEDDDA
jgi:MoaA/NifB/PqqE/SkfB family radical SAM enzyme